MVCAFNRNGMEGEMKSIHKAKWLVRIENLGGAGYKISATTKDDIGLDPDGYEIPFNHTYDLDLQAKMAWINFAKMNMIQNYEIEVIKPDDEQTRLF